MAKSLSRTMRVDLPPDALVEVLVDPDFQEAREKAQDALDASVKEVSRSDDRLVYEVHTTEYAKGVTGIDRSKTETIVTTYDWDLKARSCTWVYRSPQGPRVRVSGSCRVVSDGDGSKVQDDMVVEIKVPIVGKKIEGLVMSGIEKGWPKYEAVLRDFASRAGS